MNLHNFAQLLFVAGAVGRPDVRLLFDIYHLHKGGSWEQDPLGE